MTDFFENKEFLVKLDLITYKKTKVLEIMKKIKEKNTELTIDIFLCMLDKIYDPSTSYIYNSSATYIRSVELWNKYIFDNYKCDFNLLISYENLCF